MSQVNVNDLYNNNLESYAPFHYVVSIGMTIDVIEVNGRFILIEDNQEIFNILGVTGEDDWNITEKAIVLYWIFYRSVKSQSTKLYRKETRYGSMWVAKKSGKKSNILKPNFSSSTKQLLKAA